MDVLIAGHIDIVTWLAHSRHYFDLGVNGTRLVGWEHSKIFWILDRMFEDIWVEGGGG